MTPNSTVRARPASLPLVIGHRGDAAHAPENTLLSISQALGKGVDGVEVDVRQTADGALVLMHDETVDRTTDGAGRVADMTLRQLQSLNACRPKTDRFRDLRPEPVPTLQEALALVRGCGVMVLDVKALGYEQAIGQEVLEMDMEGEVIACGWDETVTRALQEAMPGAGIGIIGAAPKELLPAYFSYWTCRGVRCFSLHHVSISAGFVRAARARGMSVLAWTVNDVDRMDEVRYMGVDGIVTDDPGLLLERLGRGR